MRSEINQPEQPEPCGAARREAAQRNICVHRFNPRLFLFYAAQHPPHHRAYEKKRKLNTRKEKKKKGTSLTYFRPQTDSTFLKIKKHSRLPSFSFSSRPRRAVRIFQHPTMKDCKSIQARPPKNKTCKCFKIFIHIFRSHYSGLLHRAPYFLIASLVSSRGGSVICLVSDRKLLKNTLLSPRLASRRAAQSSPRISTKPQPSRPRNHTFNQTVNLNPPSPCTIQSNLSTLSKATVSQHRPSPA